MKKKRIIFISIGILVFLYLIFSFALPAFTEYKIRKILKEDTNFPYKVSFEDFDMALFRGNASMQNIKIIPDEAKEKDESVTIENADIKGIELLGFSYSNLYFRNTISTQSIAIIEPDFKLRQNKIKKNEKSESKSFRLALDNNIHIQNIRIENANAHLTAQDSIVPEVHLYRFNFDIKDIRADEETLKNKIPFTYGDFQVSYDSLYYKFNPIYYLKSGKAELGNQHFSIENFEMNINNSMPETQKMLSVEQDVFSIKNGNVKTNDIDWKFKGDRLQIRIKDIVINDMSTRIYHSFIPPKKNSPSTFYSTKLRELPFDLAVDSLQITNNQLSYVEQENFQEPESSIYFSKMNISGTNIAGGDFITPETKTRLLADALFMDTGKTYVDWSFKPANKLDAFSFKGKIKNLKADKFNSFLVPLARTELTGTIQNVDFNLQGNVQKCTGTMILTYDDLQLTVLKKDGKSKNKFLSSIANLFVKNKKPKADAEEVAIENERDEPNSFFSFIWKSLFDGLKKSFL